MKRNKITNSKKEKTNKEKKQNVDQIAKPQIKAGTPVLTSCLLLIPVDTGEIIKKIKDAVKKIMKKL